MLTTPPLGLYMHFPWCVRKCPYCDFNSHTLKTDLPERAYLDLLIRDLEADLARLKPQVDAPIIETVFLGGGTPSLFSAKGLAYLFDALRARLNFSPSAEITLEANPGTVEYARFRDYRALGINRLSIGIQSFQSEKLTALGRIHGRQEGLNAAEMAHKAGFTNFNLDLMHGLPGQTLAEALADLSTAIALAPTHISWYQLTLEPNTLFYKQPPILPTDDLVCDMQEQGKTLLKAAGFTGYEISAYSKPNLMCKHNVNYWQFGDYLGIGAGAHSKITDPTVQTITRTWKLKNPKDYMAQASQFIGATEIVQPETLAFEFMLNVLRLYRPIPVPLFETRTGLRLNTITKNLERARAKELLTWNADTITPTSLGYRFYNDLVALFMPE